VKGSVAFVVNSLAAYGMGWTYSILAGGAIDFNVFQDLGEAEA
jgi:hypothetical protein